ncbi:hypothetical protein JW964_01635 [candidate division KSB1 bacterium]|nr:hypothetical protein [candidate division KSB1 bacterium]
MPRFIFYSFFILLLSCSTSDDWDGFREVKNGIEYVQNSSQGIWQNQYKLSLSPEFVIGDNDVNSPACLKSITDVDVDQAGNIYVCDYKAGVIRIFNPLGQWINEINADSLHEPANKPCQLEVSGDGTIYIMCSQGEKIFIYDPSKKLKTSFKPNMGQLYNMGVNNAGQIFLSSLNLAIQSDSLEDNQYAIHQFDEDGKLVSSFGEPILLNEHNLLVNPFSNSQISFLRNQNLIDVVHYPYQLRIFDKNGKLKKIISKRSLNDPEPEIVRVPGVPFEAYMLLCQRIQSQVFELPDGKILVHILDKGQSHIQDLRQVFRKQFSNSDFEENESGTLVQHSYNLFDATGRYLQTFEIKELPEAILKFVDLKGRMYIRSRHPVSGNLILYVSQFRFENIDSTQSGAEKRH